MKEQLFGFFLLSQSVFEITFFLLISLDEAKENSDVSFSLKTGK